MTAKTAIFDLDGCLVDSEPLALSSIADILSESGIADIDVPYLRDRYLGVAIEKICADIAATHGHDCPADFSQRFESRLFERYRTDLRRIDGAEELLGGLRANDYGIAVATGGSIRRMGETLRVSRLDGHFGAHTYSADEVENGKPAPDLVLLAARKLGAAPGACIVVEDSPHGVTGATAAGMRSVGFVGGSHLDGVREAQANRLREAGAEAVYDSLPEVAAHLGRG